MWNFVAHTIGVVVVIVVVAPLAMLSILFDALHKGFEKTGSVIMDAVEQLG